MDARGEAPTGGTPGWIDAPFGCGGKRASLTGIRKEMLPILRAGGEAGVLCQKFGHLKWDQPFTKEKLYKAMAYLAGETGISLQYQGERKGTSFPFKWRIKP